MPKVAMTVNRSNRIFNRTSALYNYLTGVMEREVEPHFAKRFEDITASWQHTVVFVSKSKLTKNEISVEVLPKGANAKYWLWTSRGTRPHAIVAKNAPMLVFQLGYNAKTRPVGRYNVGNGRATGDIIRKREVVHPGTEARLFEETIAEQEEQWFRNKMRNAVLDFYK